MPAARQLDLWIESSRGLLRATIPCESAAQPQVGSILKVKLDERIRKVRVTYVWEPRSEDEQATIPVHCQLFEENF